MSASGITSYGGATSSVRWAVSAKRIPGSARTSAIGASVAKLDVVEVGHTVHLLQSLQQRRRDGVVDREDHHRLPSRRVAADHHARDVDVVLAEDRAHATDDAWPVRMPAHKEAALGHEVDPKRVDAYDARLLHQHGAAELVAVHAQRDEACVAAPGSCLALDDLHAARRRDEPRVDPIDAGFGEVLPHALNGGGAR